jgi:CheY-like chemotaxis protein
VIFMDHLMPGMDGFQAVQAIKNNPRTATIPIMMYTSQQGELYVGQARALGAVGVLPKLVKPVEVSKILYQLNLLPERRDASRRPLWLQTRRRCACRNHGRRLKAGTGGASGLAAAARGVAAYP